MTSPIERHTGIGGTDVSAIMGMNPWRDPYDVWLEKTGQAPEFQPNERMEIGKALERGIADLYAQRTGRRIQWSDKTRRHPKRPWQLWTPDFLIKGESGGGDCKNIALDQAGKWGEPGTDEVPDHYAIQAHWYMSASNRNFWDIAVLIAGNDFRVYTIKEDRETQQLLLEAAERFWLSHVVPSVPPPIGASPMTERFLKEKFPRNRSSIRPATADEIGLLSDYSRVRTELGVLQKQKDALENQLKAAVAEADGLESDCGYFTWKRSKDSAVLDTEKLKAEHPEIVAQYMTTREGSRRVHFMWGSK